MWAASAAAWPGRENPDAAAAYAANAVAATVKRSRRDTWLAERAVQALLLREIFGNPFHPAEMDPAWRTKAVMALVERAYQECDFEGLPVLADMLEEVGCTDEGILTHLRGPGSHVR